MSFALSYEFTHEISIAGPNSVEGFPDPTRGQSPENAGAGKFSMIRTFTFTRSVANSLCSLCPPIPRRRDISYQRPHPFPLCAPLRLSGEYRFSAPRMAQINIVQAQQTQRAAGLIHHRKHRNLRAAAFHPFQRIPQSGVGADRHRGARHGVFGA
jgi:hypothetical protein